MDIISKTILLVEDDAGLLDLLTEKIIECGYLVVCIPSAREALLWLSDNQPFLMILDYGLPDMNGSEFVTELNCKNIPLPPFIVSTGQGDERIAVEMMKLGARDYIIKDSNFFHLIPYVLSKSEKTIENEHKLRLAEQTLKANEEKQRAMIENIYDVIAIIDTNGINQYKSPNIERIFGWKPEELIGENTLNNVHPDDLDRVSNTFNNLLSNLYMVSTLEFRYKCKDNSFKWIELTASNQVQNKVINGVLLNYHDISQRKQSEKELIMAKEKAEESDRLKTAFLQNMSHEIRTPMNAIMGFSGLLLDETEDKETVKRYCEIINYRCNDLLNIIDDILDISKIESGQLSLTFENCQILSLFNELEELFLAQKKRLKKDHITLTFNTNEDQVDFSIITDVIKLKQILINLINNALKFTSKGKVEIGYKLLDSGYIEFCVKDTGIGIPEEKHDFIFERFAQIEQNGKQYYGGNGLGLPIVKGLVQLLGGNVWLKSEPGKGSIFCFTIKYEPVLSSK